MKTLDYVTCDVFTDQAFGGNPLAVVFGAEGLPTETLQAIAAEFSYSETTFVLPPKDPANTAQVRIFTPGYEMPFAGHPNVGTGFVLAQRGELFGKAIGDQMVFEEIAGLVPIEVERDAAGQIAGIRITAPKLPGDPVTVPAAPVAEAVGLTAADIDLSDTEPTLLEAGPSFVMVPITSREALARAKTANPNVDMPPVLRDGSIGLMLFVRDGEGDPAPVSARMFPLDPEMAGLTEDPATGSASAILAGHLQRAAKDAPTRLRISQGVDMGRPSVIETEVRVDQAGQAEAITVTGQCVTMMTGSLSL
ncbi:MAG: PhzF family phenazine biosynthesis protein [Alphaproteobacteria bacterium]|nr:PhzF family phenazine biosynthesis protein [Alphaproteobacteria bacterium SS10]